MNNIILFDLIQFAKLVSAILIPIPFMYVYWKLKSVRISHVDSLKNLCTLAEEFKMQKYIKNGFYLTSTFTLSGGIFFAQNISGDFVNWFVLLWVVTSILFVLAGISVFDHKGKLHNISSRLLIFILVVTASLTSIQIAQEALVFGLMMSLVIITSSIFIVVRMTKYKFVDMYSQLYFYLGFSVWNWALCAYLMLFV